MRYERKNERTNEKKGGKNFDLSWKTPCNVPGREKHYWNNLGSISSLIYLLRKLRDEKVGKERKGTSEAQLRRKIVRVSRHFGRLPCFTSSLFWSIRLIYPWIAGRSIMILHWHLLRVNNYLSINQSINQSITQIDQISLAHHAPRPTRKERKENHQD